MAKYRLLAGKHIGNDIQGKEQIWDAMSNNLIETKDNLDRHNNKQMKEVKFEKLPDDFPMAPNTRAVTTLTAVPLHPSMSADAGDEYDGMTEEELKAYAKNSKFDIRTCKNIDEIRKKVRELDVA